MYVTLAGGLAAAILDPVLIFGLRARFDRRGRVATVLSRVALVAVGLHGAWRVHKLIRLPNGAYLAKIARPFFAIGIPAVMTQIATPVGNAYVTLEIARFGDDAVAGWAIIGRLIPVAFRHDIRAFRRCRTDPRAELRRKIVYDRLLFRIARQPRTYTCVRVGCLGAHCLLCSRDSSPVRPPPAMPAIWWFSFACLQPAVSCSTVRCSSPMPCSTIWGIRPTRRYSTGDARRLARFPLSGLAPNITVPAGVIGGWGLGAVLFGIVSVIVCFSGDPQDTGPPATGRRHATGPATDGQFSVFHRQGGDRRVRRPVRSASARIRPGDGGVAAIISRSDFLSGAAPKT